MLRASIVVSLYNLRAFVAEAVESALAQELPAGEVEVIVVDDGSTDGGGELVERYVPRIRLRRQPNRGPSAARNAGLRIAQAPFVLFLDADDRLLPGMLGAQLALFDARPELGVVYTGCRFIDVAGNHLPQPGWSRREGALFPDLLLGNLGPPHLMLVRREAVVRVGGFDETLIGPEDWDLWLRLSRHGLLWGCVDQPLAEYRVRPDGVHQNVERMAENRLRVLAKAFGAPSLPAELGCLRVRAYESAYLISAGEHYQAGARRTGARWLRAAALARPALLTEPRTFRQMCRLLLPLGYQCEAAVVADRARLTALLRSMLDDLFASPDLEPAIGRRRLGARIAYWRTRARLARKSALAALRTSDPAAVAPPVRASGG